MARKKVEATCPHCEHKNIIKHDVENLGYVVMCTSCGKDIFLCDECRNANDNPTQRCNLTPNETCFRGVCYNKGK